jgi:hypothetical protein
MKRILKAWVLTNDKLVYWQGLDSICAAFLVNNFNDEATAFQSLIIFIKRFLPTFFQEDNSATIQAFLTSFRQLITFHDPELGYHLTKVGFLPDLYAIPWFLTFFTRKNCFMVYSVDVFSLHQIPQIWDKLLVIEPAKNDFVYPIFVSLGILKILRPFLIQAEFNECIQVFSDVSAVDVSTCVQKAVELLYDTPPSVLTPIYGLLSTNETLSELFPTDAPASPTRLTALPKFSTIPVVDKSDFLWLVSQNSGSLLIIDCRPADRFLRSHVEKSWCLYPSLVEVKTDAAETQDADINGQALSPTEELENMLVRDAKARFKAILCIIQNPVWYCIIVGTFMNNGRFEQQVPVFVPIIL